MDDAQDQEGRGPAKSENQDAYPNQDTDRGRASAWLATSRAAYGDDFVAYTLNADPGTLNELERTPERSNAIAILDFYARRILATDDKFHRELELPTIIGAAPPQLGIGLISWLRLQCGGELPNIAASDEVETLLLQCVRDLYPVMLFPGIEQSTPVNFPGFGTASHRLKSIRLLQIAILKDKDLKRLFPEVPEPESLDLELPIHATSFVAGLVDGVPILVLHYFAEALISYALVIAGIHGELTHEACARHAREGLNIARALARGDQVDLPLIVGLSNIYLADGVDRIEITGGVLQRWTPTARGRLHQHGIPRAIEVVLISTVRQKLLKVQPIAIGQQIDVQAGAKLWETVKDRVEAVQAEIKRKADMVRYSLLLASKPDGFIGAIAESTTYLTPMRAMTDATLAGAILGAPTPRIPITPEMVGDIERWTDRVMEDHPKGLDIGMRRILSAATARHDPMDGFIDAVLSWENLFGGNQDTAFKVCGSLALLLEPSEPSKRETLFSELTELYGKRSKLVHGATEPVKSATQDRERALEIALAAMRAAYDMPGLLTLKDSTERHKRVILGFPVQPKALVR